MNNRNFSSNKKSKGKKNVQYVGKLAKNLVKDMVPNKNEKKKFFLIFFFIILIFLIDRIKQNLLLLNLKIQILNSI